MPLDFENWKEIQLPCGQCVGCKMDNAQDWAVRCVLESKLWEQNYFVTLTYDEQHVPLHPVPVVLDEETGEAGLRQTLIKEDMADFMKNLRRQHEYHFEHQGVRFFGCGEYGGKTERPHMHILLFNCPLNDLEPLFINKQHQQVYRSAYLEKIWKKGIVSVGEITYESRAYTRRYILKKQQMNNVKPGQLPEFTNMSRKPGIAAEYYKQHKEEIYKNDEITIKKALSAAINTKPPKFFDKLYEKEEEQHLSEVKKKRRERAQDARENKQLRTSLSPVQQLEVAERNYLKRISTLKRELREEDY